MADLVKELGLLPVGNVSRVPVTLRGGWCEVAALSLSILDGTGNIRE